MVSMLAKTLGSLKLILVLRPLGSLDQDLSTTTGGSISLKTTASSISRVFSFSFGTRAYRKESGKKKRRRMSNILKVSADREVMGLDRSTLSLGVESMFPAL